MEDLLYILQDIIGVCSQRTFTALCWHHLIHMMASELANSWTYEKRYSFMVFCQDAIITANAVYIIHNALVKGGMTDLNAVLAADLAEPLEDLEYFEDVNNREDLSKEIDEYVCMPVLQNGKESFDQYPPEFVASHFKRFFLTILSLNITERVAIAKSK